MASSSSLAVSLKPSVPYRVLNFCALWEKQTTLLFLAYAGIPHLTIQLRDRDIELGPGELFVVPRGVQHCPKADEEAHVLLIEPIGTPNTGDAGGELTATEERIYGRTFRRSRRVRKVGSLRSKPCHSPAAPTL